jgi:hypothetical protein
MRNRTSCSSAFGWIASLVAASTIVLAVPASACQGPKEAREADRAAIEAFVQGRRVLTFAGYSGAGYEHPEVMLERATDFLKSENPAQTLVNVGATEAGIGAVYEVAKRMGFTTMGVVSTLARDESVTLSKCADHVFFVEDATWGGRLPDIGELSPTSEAIVALSALMVGIGGGDIARDEMLAAKERGRPVIFIPADMNHAVARAKAAKRGDPEPTDFTGSAHKAFAKQRRGPTQ